MIKVVMVSKALVVGAYQRKLEELALYDDIELTAIVPDSWREGGHVSTLERAHTSGYNLVVAPLAFNGQFHLHYYPTLGPLLRRLQPDVLHMDEEPYNLATWLGLRLAARVGAAGLFFTWQNLKRRYPPPFRWFERDNYRLASHALAGNRTAVGVLRGKGYAGPVSVVPQFGVDPDLFAPEPPGNGAATVPGGITIGYAGRLVPEKGVDVLLRAFAAAAHGDWRLVTRGEGPQRAALELLSTELGTGSRVEFLGKLPSTDMPAFYRSLDIFVLPSLTRPNWAEQFARVLIEAMACGVPILGSSSGEIPDVLGDGGLVFAEGDAGALAGMLQELAADPARRAAIGCAGRARVLAGFTQAQIAAATVGVYRQMLAGRTLAGATGAGTPSRGISADPDRVL